MEKQIVVRNPVGALDQAELIYTLTNLFRPFPVAFSFQEVSGQEPAVRLVDHASSEILLEIDSAFLRQAFERISGKVELALPKDSLGRLDEDYLKFNYGTPDLSQWALSVYRKLSGCNDYIGSLTVHLTHDVDRVNPYDPMGLMRRLLIPTRGISSSLGARLGDFWRWIRNSHNFPTVFAELMQLESNVGAKATYFCMSGPYSFRKTGSRTGACKNNKRLRKFFSLLQKYGHRLGLHGCAYSLLNQDYNRQREALAAASGLPVTWHRNHYLVWDASRSPAALRDAGFMVDSTLGFNSRQSFRAGLSWPYELWDFSQHKPASVMEIPMVFMDAAGIIIERGSTWDLLYAQMESVSSVGGEVAVNFHPDYFLGHPLVYEGYADFLKYLHVRGAIMDAKILHKECSSYE